MRLMEATPVIVAALAMLSLPHWKQFFTVFPAATLGGRMTSSSDAGASL